MTLDTRAYLNLSALAYIDFSKSLMGATIKELIERKAIPKDDLNSNPELSPLLDPSNPLRSYKLINFEKNDITGFAAAAFQSPSGEIVFAFRGTETTENGVPVWNDAATDAIIGLTVLPPLQAQNVLDFAQSTVAKLTNNKDISINRSLQYLKNNNATATGHSLGGAIAQYLVYIKGDMPSCRNSSNTTTFNTPGIRGVIEDMHKTSVNPRDYDSHVIDYTNESDVIGDWRNNNYIRKIFRARSKKNFYSNMFYICCNTYS